MKGMVVIGALLYGEGGVMTERPRSLIGKYLLPIAALVLLCFVGSCARVDVHVSASAGPSDETPITPSCDLSEKSLSIVPSKQKTGSWCWAASAQMVLRAFGRDIRQCSIVDGSFEGLQCCADQADGEISENACVDRSGLADYGLALHKFNYNVKKPSNNPDVLWNKLVDHICKDTPVVYEEDAIGGGGHTNVIFGYRDDSGVTGRWVDLENHNSENSDFEQTSFDYEIVFTKNADPVRKAVWYTWDIQPE